MNYKWIGAILVVAACSGCGFSMAAAYKTEEKMLREIMRILQYMECELTYRLTPIPDLCRQAGSESGGVIGNIFVRLSEELEAQISPDVYSCMLSLLNTEQNLPDAVRMLLKSIGTTLGRFDLSGQLQELEAVQASCSAELEYLKIHREERLRGYQTLGLCAGAALVILFI